MDFQQVEAEYQRLKRQFEAGTLTEQDLEARLQELMVEDELGRWWMIGTETGQWYYHDGQAWVQSEPPNPLRAQPAPQWSLSVPDLWRDLGLTTLGTVLYRGIDSTLPTFGLIRWGPSVPLLFGVLFGPWVGGFVGAAGLLVPYALQGRFTAWSWGGALGAAASGALAGLLVKDARNWRAVAVAALAATVASQVALQVVGQILYGRVNWLGFATSPLWYLTSLLPSVVLLSLLTRWAIGPVRQWGLYWRDRGSQRTA